MGFGDVVPVELALFVEVASLAELLSLVEFATLVDNAPPVELDEDDGSEMDVIAAEEGGDELDSVGRICGDEFEGLAGGDGSSMLGRGCMSGRPRARLA